MAETLWYYEESGRQAGPVPESALRELIRGERLAPGARVWRSGMAGWQPWGDVPELAGPRPGATTPTGPFAAPAAPAARGGLEEVDLALVVVLSIVTLGIYGLVKFYGIGLAYARLAPGRRSTFETMFWAFVACYILTSTGWTIFPPLAFLGGVGAFVTGILLLNDVLESRAELVRTHGLRVDLMSDGAHRVLWIAGWLTTWLAGLGLVLLVVQAFKFFQDHDALARAFRSGAGVPVAAPAGPLPTAPASAPGPAPTAQADVVAAPIGTAEVLPAERACVRCASPLSPADRFCSRCGAPVT